MVMASEKLMARQASTPERACPAVGPKPVIIDTSTNSTTPRPPGVMGMGARILANPYATNKSMGEMKWLKASTNTHKDAASSSQLMVAQVAALISSGVASKSAA